MRSFFFRSLRFKIILLNFVTLTVTVFVFSLLLYLRYSDTLYDKMNSLMDLKARGIESSLRAYWQAERPAGLLPDLSKLFFGKKEGIDDFEGVAGFLMAGQLSEGKESAAMAVHIFDANGRLVASSRDVPALLRLEADGFIEAVKGRKRYRNLYIPSRSGQSIAVRMLTVPVAAGCVISFA